MSTVIWPDAGHVTVVTGQVPQVSSADVSAVVAEQVVDPEQTRITGSPVHDPRGVVQLAAVPAVLLQPTV